MAIARKIAYNVVFNFALKVISTVAIALLSIRLITGYLGKEGFGDYATILAFFAFFSAIADLGVGFVTAREISREGADEERILGRVASFRVLSAFSVFLFSPLIFLFLDYPTHVEIGIWIASLAVIFSSFSLFLNGIFQKNVAMDRVAIVEFIGKIIQLSLLFLIVRYNLGFLPVVSTLVISLGFNATAAFLFSRRYAKFSFIIDVKYWKDFLRESLPLGASALVTFFYFKMDTILLSLIQGSAAVGTYGVAYKVMENLTFFPAMLAGLVLPLLSRFIYTDRKKFTSIADTTFRVFWILSLPIVIGTVFLAPSVIAIVSGSGFEDSVSVLRIIIFSLMFVFFGHFFNMILIVGNLQKKLLKALVFVALFNISVNLVLIKKFSFLGAAFTSAATEFLVALVIGFIAAKTLGYVPSFRKIPRVAVAAFIMAGFLWVFSSLPFLALLFLSGMVYFVALWVFRAVTTEEIATIFKKEESGRVALGEEVV